MNRFQLYPPLDHGKILLMYSLNNFELFCYCSHNRRDHVSPYSKLWSSPKQSKIVWETKYVVHSNYNNFPLYIKWKKIINSTHLLNCLEVLHFLWVHIIHHYLLPKHYIIHYQMIVISNQSIGFYIYFRLLNIHIE